MVDKALTIRLKQSNTASAVPSAGALAVGEPALNLADKKLYSKDNSGTVFQVAPSKAEHDLKANIASPTFTGVPTAPTATVGTNTSQLATTAFVASAVAGLVSSAPAALDTLNELAAALGNDANFATTMTNALAAKAPLASPTFTGVPVAPTASAGTSTTQIATTAFANAAAAAAVTAADFDTIVGGTF